jgi:hypothetical protein
MDALVLIRAKRAELQEQINRLQADLFAIQGALQVLDMLEAELSPKDDSITVSTTPRS